MSRVAGRWFITPHAVDRFRERVHWARRFSYAKALGELINASERAHFVRILDSGKELWRGPKPMKLRLIVAPSATPGELPQLVTVRPLFRGPSMPS